MLNFMRAIAFACVLVSAPVAAAQTVGGPLQVRTGEIYTVSVEQTQSTELGEREIEATLTHTYALHIVDAENRVWRYMPVSLGYSLPTGLGIEQQAANINWPVMSEAMSAMLRLATDVGLECRVNEYGACAEMTNWPLWRDRAENLVLMADAFARFIPEAATAPSTPGALEVVPEPPASHQPTSATKPNPGAPESETPGMAPTPAMNWSTLRGPVLRGIAAMLDNVDSRDAAAGMASIQAAAGIQGRALTRRQRVDVTDELEMPFGAPPLRFTGTMRLERINRADNTAIIVRRVTMDEAAMRASLQAMSRFVTANLVEPVAQVSAGSQEDMSSITAVIDGMLDSVGLAYEETTTGVVDLATGMARETTTTYTYTMRPPAGISEAPMVLEGRTIVRVTPGAPEVSRLPRG